MSHSKHTTTHPKTADSSAAHATDTRIHMPASTETETLTLRDVRRIDLNAGDTLVITLEQSAKPATLAAIREHMRGLFPDNECLILDAGTDLAVITANDSTG
jgi:hypothetical protein